MFIPISETHKNVFEPYIGFYELEPDVKKIKSYFFFDIKLKWNVQFCNCFSENKILYIELTPPLFILNPILMSL